MATYGEQAPRKERLRKEMASGKESLAAQAFYGITIGASIGDVAPGMLDILDAVSQPTFATTIANAAGVASPDKSESPKESIEYNGRDAEGNHVTRTTEVSPEWSAKRDEIAQRLLPDVWSINPDAARGHINGDVAMSDGAWASWKEQGKADSSRDQARSELRKEIDSRPTEEYTFYEDTDTPGLTRKKTVLVGQDFLDRRDDFAKGSFASKKSSDADAYIGRSETFHEGSDYSYYQDANDKRDTFRDELKSAPVISSGTFSRKASELEKSLGVNPSDQVNSIDDSFSLSSSQPAQKIDSVTPAPQPVDRSIPNFDMGLGSGSITMPMTGMPQTSDDVLDQYRGGRPSEGDAGNVEQPPQSSRPRRNERTDEDRAESRRLRLENQQKYQAQQAEKMIRQRFGVQPNWIGGDVASGGSALPSGSGSDYGSAQRAGLSQSSSIRDFMTRSTETHEATAEVAASLARRTQLARSKILESNR